MKIEVGKTYKSNIPDRNNFDPSKSLPENWTIHSFLSESNSYLAYCHKVDGVRLWREFDADGNDGRTKTGNPRRLIPNTRTVVKWALASGLNNLFTTMYPTRESAELDRLAYNKYSYQAYVVELRYEVEE